LRLGVELFRGIEDIGKGSRRTHGNLAVIEPIA
jgi:hypothetical protein